MPLTGSGTVNVSSLHYRGVVNVDCYVFVRCQPIFSQVLVVSSNVFARVESRILVKIPKTRYFPPTNANLDPPFSDPEEVGATRPCCAKDREPESLFGALLDLAFYIQ